MRFKLDFDNKEITVDGSINLKELLDKLKELCLDVKEWKIGTNGIQWYYGATIGGTQGLPNIHYYDTCSGLAVGKVTNDFNIKDCEMRTNEYV